MAETREYNKHSKALGTYQCGWCHKLAIRPMNDAIRQSYCSNGCAKRARGKQPQHLPNEFDDSFGNWLAGFADGESTFILHIQKGIYVTPRFVIRLRDDDRAILEEIKDRLGFGDVEAVKQNYNETRPGTNPAVIYECRSYGECNGIVELFEKYKLRAKKQRDFELWSEGVKLGLTDCEDREKFIAIATKLTAIRKYI